MPRRDTHPLVLALVDRWARASGFEADQVWRWLDREEAPPTEVVAAAVEAFWPLVREADFLLTSSPESDTPDTMAATENVVPGRVRRSQALMAKDAAKHPFTAALKAKGLTVDEFAQSIGYPRTTVQSWYRSGEHARAIPRAAAKAIKAALGVPLSAWREIEG